ncbi:xylulose kinase [Actinoplanes sp. TBRC 11911]|uniref:xylulokinase n=1 Tax=Actinoplanes sp. TBRC 11911 TaxID=2729386 RepID=UPI00145CE257|nr:FGGY family carbohydrate kinase [Actinoplanes sp. TBRC 11911]NMO50718.1 xylulose kinase [Actinoplanes sp. TBRC 11911]
MHERVLLGVDVGTTAVKTAAFTARGELLADHTVPIGTARPREGWVEQDPEEWWRAVTAGIAAVSKTLPSGSVSSIGVVSQVNTHLLVDADLRPLGPAIVWQDQRCAAIARELDGRFDAAAKTRLWGAPVTLDASFLPARAAWFASQTPDAWAAARWVLSPKDFINARLTGHVATDMLASVRLVDGSGAYLEEVLTLVDGLARRLPPLRDPTHPLGAGVVVGTMDAFGSIFGSGLTVPGRAMVSCGTSLVVAGSSSGTTGRGRGVVAFPEVGGTYIHAGPTQAGGDALRWWAATAGVRVEDVVAEAERAPAGSSGVVFTPHLAGERAPLWDSAVRGSFFGLGSDTTRPDMSRAVLEGVAMSARQVFAAVAEAGDHPLPTVRFCGGGARSDLWAQIHADVLGVPVERLAVRDAGVLGAAQLGAVGAGIYPDVSAASEATVRTERMVEPDAGAVELLEPLFRVYTASYTALREVHRILAERTMKSSI